MSKYQRIQAITSPSPCISEKVIQYILRRKIINISRELIEDAVKVIEEAFSADENPFGILHNLATDTLSRLETVLLLEKK